MPTSKTAATAATATTAAGPVICPRCRTVQPADPKHPLHPAPHACRPTETDRLVAAMQGSERTQLITIVETLARHMQCLLVTAPKPTWPAEIRATSIELADAALHFVAGLPPEAPR